MMRINSFWGKGVARFAPILVLLLAACTPATAAPTERATVEPSATGTETPEPTKTLFPTSTSTITRTAFPTPTPFPLPYPKDHCGDFSFSPYGDWVAWVVCPDDTCGLPCLRVENFDRSIVWEVPIDSVREPYPWADESFSIDSWSTDGKYLYFTVSGGADASYASDGTQYLLQIDLTNGNVVDISPPTDAPWFAYSISPKVNEFVYIPYFTSQLSVTLRDIFTGNERTIELGEYPNFSAGNIIWSPDGEKIVFGVEKYDTFTTGDIEIILVDFEEMSSQSIVKVDYGRHYPFRWISEDEILLNMSFDLGYEVLNIKTGQLATATPRP